MRIEVIAPDPQAYSKAPLSFKLRMTREAMEKLQTAQNEGRVVELGPQEIFGVASDFVAPFNSVLSDGFASVQKLIVGPPADTSRRRLRLKLMFASDAEREEFPYVEFEVIRPGRQELEIHSSSPTLPFELSLTLNLAGSPSGISVSYALVGREVRQVTRPKSP
jgi:hypothetical protein